MEKLQLMMFEAIGYKLKFSKAVTERYFNVLMTRFGRDSEMEQQMRSFVTDTKKQQEIIGDNKHVAHEEFRRLAQMQLNYDIEKLQRQIAERPNSPFIKGYQVALNYLQAISQLKDARVILPTLISNTEYEMLKAINDSHIEEEADPRKTICGVDCQTICIVFRTMICFNDSLLANQFNYQEAKDTVKAIFQLNVKCAI